MRAESLSRCARKIKLRGGSGAQSAADFKPCGEMVILLAPRSHQARENKQAARFFFLALSVNNLATNPSRNDNKETRQCKPLDPGHYSNEFCLFAMRSRQFTGRLGARSLR